MLKEVEIDPNRVHFLGRIPYDRYRSLLQVSAAHVYLTYPFVLSWSMLEAMVCGCLVIGSDTAPVREVIEDGMNGVLVEFFDARQIAAEVMPTLNDREVHMPLRATARESTQHCAVHNGVAAYAALLADVANVGCAEPVKPNAYRAQYPR